VSKRHTYILGINAYDHDVSACLLRDGAIAFAISKERINRVKHSPGFYQQAVDYCLRAEGITLDDVDLVVRNCYLLPVKELEKRLTYQDVPEVLPPKERKQAATNPLFRSGSNTVVDVSHHVAHAYSAFAVCPFEEGALMVVDGVGSHAKDVAEKGHRIDNLSPLARESESYYRFEGSTLEPIKKVWLEPTTGFLADEFFNMDGLGALYSRVSSYIFGDWNKCGEVMGLAPYGRPDQITPLLELKNGTLTAPEWTEAFDQPYLPDTDEKWENDAGMQHWKDLAWQAQDDTERVLIERAIWLRETTGAKNLCISGGVGLNCVANGKIVREAGYDNVWIQPAAGDDGIAIGCAYYGHLAIQNKPRTYVMEHAFLGAPYSEAEVETATNKWLVDSKSCAPGDAICAETAKVLADEKVVGWFQGRSEFGPRALGNRSILADPRKGSMKDLLNARVKHRQAFRPFAPIVLAERASEVFEGEEDSPFMLIAKRVRPEWTDRIPAIVHVDGTARVQTVRREHNERLYLLLKEFETITGVPVLLNTSFNIRGEPIVETPADAMKCFLSTGIDYLAMNDILITKSRYYSFFYPIMKWGSDVATMIRVGIGADLDRDDGA
jgi:carbamoyltransferase